MTEPRCRCGHTRHDKEVIPICEYSWWGNFALLLGASVVPKRVRYRCVVCQEIIEEIEDPEILAREKPGF